MAPEERPAKIVERCAVHPNRVAAVHCAECDRPVCIRCAVPVRGRVLGPECLRAALGDEAPPEPAPRRVRRTPVELVAGAAFCSALVVTLLPWTRFGTGSGFAGAWATDLRWSMLAATATAAGVASWVLGRNSQRSWLWAQAALGVIGSIGVVLSIVHPPPFKHASAAPVVALVLLLTGATAASFGVTQASDLHR